MPCQHQPLESRDKFSKSGTSTGTSGNILNDRLDEAEEPETAQTTSSPGQNVCFGIHSLSTQPNRITVQYPGTLVCNTFKQFPKGSGESDKTVITVSILVLLLLLLICLVLVCCRRCYFVLLFTVMMNQQTLSCWNDTVVLNDFVCSASEISHLNFQKKLLDIISYLPWNPL